MAKAGEQRKTEKNGRGRDPEIAQANLMFALSRMDQTPWDPKIQDTENVYNLSVSILAQVFAAWS